MANTGKYLSKLIAMLLCAAILLSTSVSAMADDDLILGLSGSLDSGTGNTIDLASSTEETGDGEEFDGVDADTISGDISVENGFNEDDISLLSDTVLPGTMDGGIIAPLPDNTIDIGVTESRTGEGWEFDGTDTYTITGDVTVQGYKPDGVPLVFEISSDHTVTWKAHYNGDTENAEDVLVDVRGSGTFLIDDGTILRLKGEGETVADIVGAAPYGSWDDIVAAGLGSPTPFCFEGLQLTIQGKDTVAAGEQSGDDGSSQITHRRTAR